MQNGTNESRHPSTAIRIEGLRLSVKEMAAVRQGLTIALTKAHSASDEARIAMDQRLERPLGAVAGPRASCSSPPPGSVASAR